MTEVIAECAPNATPAILSGPSFAADVARGLPTAVTLAAHDETLAAELAKALASRTFRPYQSTDVRGVEIGGAAKNVLAIASGIVTGRGLGASASAALTTRGFAELVRFGRALGAKTETMMGLSGLGDLILTCSSPQSRNFSFGVNLGKGDAANDIHGKTGLAEGAFTAPVLLEMAREHNVDMPISSAVAAVLAGQMSVDEAIEFAADAAAPGGGMKVVSRTAVLLAPTYAPRKRGIQYSHPCLLSPSTITGSSAFADDDGGGCCGVMFGGLRRMRWLTG